MANKMWILGFGIAAATTATVTACAQTPTRARGAQGPRSAIIVAPTRRGAVSNVRGLFAYGKATRDNLRPGPPGPGSPHPLAAGMLTPPPHPPGSHSVPLASNSIATFLP